MRFETKKSTDLEDLLLVSVTGDFIRGPQLVNFKEIYEKHNNDLIIDFTNVEMLHSSGGAALIQMYSYQKNQENYLDFVNLNGKIDNNTLLKKIFNKYTQTYSVDHAISKYRSNLTRT